MVKWKILDAKFLRRGGGGTTYFLANFPPKLHGNGEIGAGDVCPMPPPNLAVVPDGNAACQVTIFKEAQASRNPKEFVYLFWGGVGNPI